MPENCIEIQPINHPLDATVRPPGSKSITNRALLLASLACGTSSLTGVLDSEDTRLMANGLRQLGAAVIVDWSTSLATVQGTGGKFPVKSSDIFCGNSGTTLRFLTAAAAFSGGRHRLSGVGRMHQRPVGDLVAALQLLGSNISAQSPGDCPPVVIDSPPVEGGRTRVRSEISSQFLSAILMSAPMAAGDVSVSIEGNPVSMPYIDMTLAMMKTFGVIPAIVGPGELLIHPAKYQGTGFAIEPDASAASYFFAAAAIVGGTVRVALPGLDSLQGDVAFVDLLEQMGCQVTRERKSVVVAGPARHGIDCDMSAISDTAQTLSVVSLFVMGPTTIRGIAHNRVKETDRIGNLALELRKLGATVTEHADGMTIIPGKLQRATVDTHDDHRMAMSLALAGLRIPGVQVRDPDCARKTFPDFFNELARLGDKTSAKDQT